MERAALSGFIVAFELRLNDPMNFFHTNFARLLPRIFGGLTQAFNEAIKIRAFMLADDQAQQGTHQAYIIFQGVTDLVGLSQLSLNQLSQRTN